MIRNATHTDIPGIEAALMRLKRRTEFVGIRIEFERARKTVRQCISSPQGFAMVAEHAGRITGVMLGIVNHLWFSADRTAQDLVLYSQRRGDGEALMRAFIEWAHAKNATPLVGSSSGMHGERLRRFYTDTLGLHPIGGFYIGERPNAFEQAVRRAS